MQARNVVALFCVFFGSVFADDPQNPEVTYLDYAASWSISKSALDEFGNVSLLDGNSSGINPHSKRLKRLEKRSASIIARKIDAKPEQIHFTSGATAANNIAILGVAYKNPGCHLITSKIEHKSVLNVFKYLEKNGWKVTYLDVDKSGFINLKQLQESIRRDTKLISIQMFNSEIGALQNVKEIGKIARQHNVLFHTDAAQSFCKYDINVEKMSIDLLTISGHKIGAPKGIGALYVRDASKLQPIMFGSGDIFFTGTKPTALICAFAKAAEHFRLDREQIIKNYNALISQISKIGGVHINSSIPSHVVSISIDGVLLQDILDCMQNYSFSAGCSCLGQEKSNVIAAIDPDNQLPACTIRISFSDKVNEQQLTTFAEKLKFVVEQLRKEKKIGKGCQSLPETSKKDLRKGLEKVQQLMSISEKS